MNQKSIFLTLISLALGGPVSRADEPCLWYEKPAKNAMNEALPVGNGRIGGMVFGGVEMERIQLNEDSLWTGDDHAYGAYQTLGDLYLSLETGSKPLVTCPSGNRAWNEAEDLPASFDGDPQTKWCVEHHDKPVIWQVQAVAGAPAATSYILTSANDTPNRDPRNWEFAGSADGEQWTLLDKHDDEGPFAKRFEAKTFNFKNTNSYKFYRLTILKNQGDPQIQLAEIAISNLRPAPPALPVTGYRRELNLSTATATTTFARGGVLYTREVFASQPDQVIAVRWTSQHPASISGTIGLKGAHHETTTAEGSTLTFRGALGNKLQYETSARVIAHGGKLEIVDGTIQVKGADEIVILLAANTDYVFDYSHKNLSGLAPHDRVSAQLDAAARKPYETIRAAHLKNFQALFNRVTVDFGKSSPSQTAMPIDKRKVEAATKTDPELEQLLFQYGRYLLISCSRPGSLPANLQGLWNDSNTPAWECDYHANINVQMNYWPAESTNLTECHEPLFDWMKCLLEPWRKNTSEENEFALPSGKIRGWAVRTGVNTWGAGTFLWDKTANAWLCQHLWEHYAFGGDKAYLKSVSYPMIKEIVEFWEDHLKALPDGRLVVPHGWSPEHGPQEDGTSYNQQIVWDLFQNYTEAADALGVDKAYRDKIAALRDKLVGPKIGKWGQLQEWMDDKDDPNDHHRHTSNLFAVYPGRQVSVTKTPELAAAAKKSLDARGPTGDVREWSFAWRTALYARLHDGENAHAMLQNLFDDRNTCVNLFGLHPPMQMDGNFGITAGIAEMLVQSHEGEINLLPALPKDWPNGTIRGLRARGGFDVSIAWKDGKLTDAAIRSTTGSDPKVRYGANATTLKLAPGKTAFLKNSSFGSKP